MGRERAAQVQGKTPTVERVSLKGVTFESIAALVQVQHNSPLPSYSSSQPRGKGVPALHCPLPMGTLCSPSWALLSSATIPTSAVPAAGLGNKLIIAEGF